jgi:hypothetical protein
VVSAAQGPVGFSAPPNQAVPFHALGLLDKM